MTTVGDDGIVEVDEVQEAVDIQEESRRLQVNLLQM